MLLTPNSLCPHTHKLPHPPLPSTQIFSFPLLSPLSPPFSTPAHYPSQHLHTFVPFRSSNSIQRLSTRRKVPLVPAPGQLLLLQERQFPTADYLEKGILSFLCSIVVFASLGGNFPSESSFFKRIHRKVWAINHHYHGLEYQSICAILW